MNPFGRLDSCAFLAAAFLSCWVSPSEAGCGIDWACAISESVGRGAGQGAADSLRPLVTDVMERQAPALIAQLQAGVDHNILTTEHAGDRMIDYATSLFKKAADDVANNVQNRSQSLMNYAVDQTLEVERTIFSDVQTIINEFHCESLSMAALIERQQKVSDENVNDWIKKIEFWSRAKTDQIQVACRNKLSIAAELKFSDMQIPTISKLWRCVRLSYIDPNGPAVAIKDAYDDVVVNGHASMCALRSGDATPLRDVTETWIADRQSARAWDRALHGE